MNNINWGISELKTIDQVGLEDFATFNSHPPPNSSTLSSPSYSYLPFPSSEFLNSPNILSSPTSDQAFAAQNYSWRSTSSEDQQRNKEEEINYSDFPFQYSPSIFQGEPLKKQDTWKFKEPIKDQTNLSSIQNFSSSEMEATKPKMEGNLASESAVQRRSEDGYKWRKYGEKQVKGSENPRSYYKCTNPNCFMKKKVERNLEGQITEIVYKGSHNHPKPQACRRTSFPSISSQHSTSCTISGVSNQSVVTLGNPQIMEVVSMQEDSSVSVGEEDFEQTSQTSYSGADENDFGPEGKRWKGENNEIDGSRTVREPRVVVLTTSEIDILDDGYRWRKYGQKVVKGNPNPRSYYKCTGQGCRVRKHVERAAHDAKAVITTYEGKHNHDVPASRSRYNTNRSALNGTNTMPIRPSAVPNYSSFTNSLYNARPPPTYQSPQQPFPLQMFQSPTASFGSSYANHAQRSDVNKYEQ